MEKKMYETPEMDTVEFKYSNVLISASGEAPGDGGSGDGIDE